MRNVWLKHDWLGYSNGVKIGFILCVVTHGSVRILSHVTCCTRIVERLGIR